MRFINEMTPHDWVLWAVLWSCVGLLAGGLALVVALSVGAPV